jgi:hypothetical protein
MVTERSTSLRNYSDFGNTTNYKLASRYKLTDNINIRGASTGFRAPSLHQIYSLQLYSQMVSHLKLVYLVMIRQAQLGIHNETRRVYKCKYWFHC